MESSPPAFPPNDPIQSPQVISSRKKIVEISIGIAVALLIGLAYIGYLERHTITEFLVKTTHDASSCDSIPNKYTELDHFLIQGKVKCLSDVAIATNDPSYCALIKDTDADYGQANIFFSSCYTQLATNTHDPHLCEPIISREGAITGWSFLNCISHAEDSTNMAAYCDEKYKNPLTSTAIACIDPAYINKQDPQGSTLLMVYASDFGNSTLDGDGKILAQIMALHPNVNIQNNDGNSALHLLVFNPLKILTSDTIKTSEVSTKFGLLNLSGHVVAVLNALIKAGGDPDLKNKAGDTPISLVEKNYSTSISDYAPQVNPLYLLLEASRDPSAITKRAQLLKEITGGSLAGGVNFKTYLPTEEELALDHLTVSSKSIDLQKDFGSVEDYYLSGTAGPLEQGPALSLVVASVSSTQQVVNQGLVVTEFPSSYPLAQKLLQNFNQSQYKYSISVPWGGGHDFKRTSIQKVSYKGTTLYVESVNYNDRNTRGDPNNFRTFTRISFVKDGTFVQVDNWGVSMCVDKSPAWCLEKSIVLRVAESMIAGS